MKKAIFIFFLSSMIYNTSVAQSLSQTRIVYESQDEIVMNNGDQYDILATTDFQKDAEKPAKSGLQIFDHTLTLNRVLVIKNNQNFKKLVEWSKGTVRFYEYREALDFKLEENELSNFAGVVVPD